MHYYQRVKSKASRCLDGIYHLLWMAVVGHATGCAVFCVASHRLLFVSYKHQNNGSLSERWTAGIAS